MDVNALSSGNDNMANMLKEMLKIDGSAHSAVQEHNGAGDARDQSHKAASPQREDDHASREIPNDGAQDDKVQTIKLSNVLDGDCVELVGDETKIISSFKTELDSLTPSSDKIKFNTIIKYDWEHCFYPGNLISVTDVYMAYSIKAIGNNVVRVINRKDSSDRALMKGFDGVVTDIAFSHSTSNTLAAADDAGNLFVWNFFQISGKIKSQLKLHIAREEPIKPATHRLVWIPNVQNEHSDEENSNSDKQTENDVHTLVLFHKNVAEVWDLDVVQPAASTENVKILRSQVQHAYVTVSDYSDDISDCELSPVGNVLAAASYDGSVKFWQVEIMNEEAPVCLHQWQPHDGKPVTAVRFCDDKKQTELSVFWRFLLTGCDRNIEFKIWCTVTWNCLQIVSFEPSTPGHAVPEMNIVLHHSADYIVLSDIHRKVLYVMQMTTDLDKGKARVTSVAHFTLASPLLSMAMVNAKRCDIKEGVSSRDNEMSFEDPDADYESEEELKLKEDQLSEESDKTAGVLIELLAIQQRCLQHVDVRFCSTPVPQKDDATEAAYDGAAEDTDEHLMSLHSISSTKTPSLVIPTSDDNFLASGDRFDSKANDNTTDESNNKVAEDKPLVPIEDEASDVIRFEPSTSVVAPSTPPLLLTPDALLSSCKALAQADSANTSFTSVTPFSHITGSFYQQESPAKENIKAPSPRLPSVPPGYNDIMKSDEIAIKMPPSSPVFPQAVSSPPSQAAPATAAAEILQSFCSSRTSVKSPDLIASTSNMDDAKHESASSIPVAAPPGLSKRIAPASPQPSSEPAADVFSSILVPVSSAPASTWPKAPDVTMSRPAPSRSPSQVSSVQILANHVAQMDDVSTSRDVAANQESASQAMLQNQQIYDELMASFRGLRDQQKTLLSEQQRKLDSITKKQNQSQKQMEAAGKRSDQQAERIEKSIKSLGDSHRRLSNDMKSSQASVSDVVVSKIDRVVKSEVKRTILPGMTSSIDEMKEQLSSSVAKQLTATDTALKETIAKHIKSKEVIDSVSSVTSRLLMEQLQSSIPQILMESVVPAFERSCQNMFQQLSTAYKRGMDDAVKQLEKQMQFRLRSEFERLQQVSKEANEAVTQLQNAAKTAQSSLTANIHKQYAESIDKMLGGFEDKLTSKVLQSLKQQQAKDWSNQQKLIAETVQDIVGKALEERLPAARIESESSVSAQAGVENGARSSQPNPFDQQQRILKMLLRGEYNAAFQTALTAADLNLVMYVCETVEPSAVFGSTPCPLQQPILLSLIQQLSSNLTTKTALKLSYLQDAVMNLDKNHKITQEYLHTVIGALIQSIRACLQGPLENPGLSSDLRMLAMAAQSLMK